jgi:hypothetical protein
MAWPEQIELLLALSDSRVSLALRWGLRGLRGSLQAALEETPDGPGSEELRGLLSELDSLLLRARPTPELELPSADQRDVPADQRDDDSSRSQPRLLPLARAVAADQRLASALQRSPLRQDNDEMIWNGVQRLLLRLAPGLAEEWRRRSLSLAEQAGASPDESQVATVALGWDEMIYPGLTGAVQATGLRSTATAALDPRVASSTDKNLHFLACVTSTYLWFIEQDPNLRHCLKSVFRFGISPLTGEQRERYTAELLRLWERARAGAERKDTTRPGLKERFKELLDLDEALHSLIYQPPVAPDSWWSRLQNQVRGTLFQARDRAAAADYPVHLQLLGGNFADINRLAPDSLQTDDGVPGEVSACVRVWARVDGEELKGRVLYRSPGEDT